MSTGPETSLKNHQNVTIHSGTDQPAQIVVIGAGPVGQRICEELHRFDPQQNVMLFGDEPYEPYDRVKLSSFLAGESVQPWTASQSHDESWLQTVLGNRIARIDRYHQCVYDALGNRWPYSHLVLATGSRAYIPPIHGTDLANVFSFRNMADAEQLKARTISSRHTIVIGGGLLGLEAARAMRRFNTRVTVIEQSAWLMFRQLDSEAAELLRSQIESRGIHVVTNMRVQSIQGDDRVDHVVLTGGQILDCDTVVIAAGIQPNIELAMDAGLHTRRGILANDRLQTNDPLIYAVGECAEYQNTVYGLVKPGFEQAAVAASTITGGRAHYRGSQLVTQLKLIESPVFSIGEPSTEWTRREVTYHDKEKGLIRKLFLNGNRLDAALAVGEWPEFTRLQEAVGEHRRVWPWQLVRFAQTGNLWNVNESLGVLAWPASATVCNCMDVSRGDLTVALQQNCRDVQCLAERTGASTVCGTCRPLLQQLLGTVGVDAVRAARLLTVGAVLSLLFVLATVLFPDMGYRTTVQVDWHWDVLWTESLNKQISGFTLLGMSVVLAFLSLPKRLRKIRWGDFALWRGVHVGVGVAVVLALVAHTGMRMGHELNYFLMLTFTGLILAGALVSGAVGMQHRLPIATARYVREWSLWSHIVLLWPFPALLGFHILKTYWY